MNEKNFHEALLYQTKALEYKPNDQAMLRERGISYMAIKENLKAYTDFSTLIKLSDKNGAAYYMRALIGFNLDFDNIQDKTLDRPSPCDDLKRAKELGYPAKYEMFNLKCRDI